MAPARREPAAMAPARREPAATSFALAIATAETSAARADPALLAQPAAAAAAAAAAEIEPTLCGAPPELLYALLDVCRASEDEAHPHAELAGACLAELARMGLHAAPPADASVLLRRRAEVLEQRVAELSEASDEWAAASEVQLALSAAELSAEELDAPGMSALAALPEAPPLDAQVAALRMQAALCADQVELALLSMGRLCGQSKAAERSLAKTIHQETFHGYLDIQEPRLLIRSIAAR